MAFLIIMPDHDPDSWVRHLRSMEPGLDLRIWPNTGATGDIDFVLVWNHPPGVLGDFPHLKCIASMGAGVDHILRDPHLPPDVPVTRIVDPAMAVSMSEYLVTASLEFIQHRKVYFHDQVSGEWAPRIPRRAADTPVGIMGMGHLGRSAARSLRRVGFPVAGWRRSAGDVEGVTVFHGDAARVSFLEQTQILINLLPLTAATRRILNSETFSHLLPDAYVINAARGEHLAEADLLKAIDAGRLAGACLDVFQTEPLPVDHPFRQHPAIIVTPHVASLTNPKSVLPRILENYRRVMEGLAPHDQVDRKKGY